MSDIAIVAVVGTATTLGAALLVPILTHLLSSGQLMRAWRRNYRQAERDKLFDAIDKQVDFVIDQAALLSVTMGKPGVRYFRSEDVRDSTIYNAMSSYILANNAIGALGDADFLVEPLDALRGALALATTAVDTHAEDAGAAIKQLEGRLAAFRRILYEYKTRTNRVR